MPSATAAFAAWLTASRPSDPSSEVTLTLITSTLGAGGAPLDAEHDVRVLPDPARVQHLHGRQRRGGRHAVEERGDGTAGAVPRGDRRDVRARAPDRRTRPPARSRGRGRGSAPSSRAARGSGRRRCPRRRSRSHRRRRRSRPVPSRCRSRGRRPPSTSVTRKSGSRRIRPGPAGERLGAAAVTVAANPWIRRKRARSAPAGRRRGPRRALLGSAEGRDDVEPVARPGGRRAWPRDRRPRGRRHGRPGPRRAARRAVGSRGSRRGRHGRGQRRHDHDRDGGRRETHGGPSSPHDRPSVRATRPSGTIGHRSEIRVPCFPRTTGPQGDR